MSVAVEIEKGRGRPRKQETSQRILAAAYELLTELSYAEVSYEKIAERANVTRPTIYRRWAAKEILITDAVAGVINDFNRSHPALEDEKENFRGALYNLVTALDEKKLGIVVANIIGAMPHNNVLANFVHKTQQERRQHTLEKIINKAIEKDFISADRKMGPILDMALGAIYFRLLISGEVVDHSFVDDLVEDLFR